MSTYPPDDRTDFANADAGHITSLHPCVISSDTNQDEIVWDNDAYRFILGPCHEDTANPSLWRQSQLCHKQGLYKVMDGIYQVRGLDISNMTFVETLSTNGVVVIDPLTSNECARAALQMYQEYRPKMTIRAMIYTHSHSDHFGGSQAIVDAAGGSLDIYAPDGFLENAVSENVYAGIAMGRRAVYMYGESLPKDPTGQIGTGLGMTASTGKSSLVVPTIDIKKTTGRSKYVDDLEIVFQVTPGTEAPAEMNFHFPQYRALCMAENAVHTLHNIQTLRGALVRDARLWSQYLDEAIVLFGKNSDVCFSSHHWPTFDNQSILTYLSQQRDLYAYLHNETLRLLNDGMTGLEIAEGFILPDSLNNLWNARGYYGSVSHNVKAIYHRYMGWFDGNPAHLWEHPPVAAAQRYVDCMGGIEKVIDLGVSYSTNNDLRFASTLLSHAVFSNQTNVRARKELSTVFTKLGYGAENGTWRNFYLCGAQELLGKTAPAMNSISTESLMALDTLQLMNTWAIRINGPKAALVTPFTVDIMITDDTPSGWHMNMSNGALTGHAIAYLEYPDLPTPPASLTFWPTHRQLVDLINGDAQGFSGIQTSGDVNVWTTLQSLLTPYNLNFAIVTPEKLWK